MSSGGIGNEEWLFATGSRLCSCTSQFRAPLTLTVRAGLKCMHFEFVLF